MFNLLRFVFSPHQWVELFTFYGGGGKGGGDAPDYSALAAASEKAAILGKELGDAQLAENKRQYDLNSAVSKPVIEAQTALMQQQQQQGDDYFNYMKQFSRPAEQSLFYESMGFNPDEIAQIEALRGSEQAAAQARADQEAGTPGAPSFIDMPTTTVKTVLPEGAVKGSEITSGRVATNNPIDPRYQRDYSMGAQIASGWGTKGNTTYSKPQADSYYVKNANGTYRLVTPTYENVEGTKQVEVPGQTTKKSASSYLDNSGSSALIAKLAATAGLRQQQEASDNAIADSRKGFTDAGNMAIRQGMRYGMSADKIAAAQGALAAQQAEAQAGAASGARDKAKNLSYAKKLDVAGLYRGLPGASQAAYGLTLNAGNSAVNNQNSTSAQYVNGMNAGTNTIMSGQNMQINGLGTIANAQTSAYNAANAGDGGLGALGSMIGQMGSAYINKTPSDKNVKKDIKETSDDEALEAINNTPVKSWKYDDTKIDNEDSETHIGPMAQDVQKNMGDKAGPGGKMIDLISLNGINMAAVRALSKKVDNLERKTKGKK